MPTTSNFGWTTPADTDLVKDGALAIRTLGNGIDTSLIDLKGGTTGQILSKASNTDLDYTWINNDVGDITNVAVTAPITGGGSSGSVTIGIDDGTTTQKGAVQLEDSTSSTSTTKAATPNSVKSAYDLANAAIPKSLVDAAGDLIYATADNTVARLGIGTAGQVLKVNSGATAPEWGAAAGGGDFVKIAAATFTDQASVTVDSAFSSSYKTYMVQIMAGNDTVSSDDLQIQLRYSNTTQTSDYYGSYFEYNRSNTLATGGYSNTAQMMVSQELGIVAAPTSITLHFNQVGNASEKANFYGTGINVENEQAATVFTGWVNVARTYTGFLIKSSGANITGSYAVWGLKR